MAEDVIIHGDFVQFSGAARCEACRAKDLKCALQQSDEGCMACAGATRECIFSRSVIVAGPKSGFAWATLLNRQSEVPLRTSAPSETMATKTHALGSTSNGFGAPGAASSEVLAITNGGEDSPIHPLQSRQAAGSRSNELKPTTARAPAEPTPERVHDNPYTPRKYDDSRHRRGLEPTRRQGLGEILSLAEQAYGAELASNNARVEQWFDQIPSEPSTPGHLRPESLSHGDVVATPSAEPHNDRTERKGTDNVVLKPGDDIVANYPETLPATLSITGGKKLEDQSPTLKAYPWTDTVRILSSRSTVSHPATANKVITQFAECARGTDAVSRSASRGGDSESLDDHSADDVAYRPHDSPRVVIPSYSQAMPTSITESSAGTVTIEGETSSRPRKTFSMKSEKPQLQTLDRSRFLYSQIPLMKATAKADGTTLGLSAEHDSTSMDKGVPYDPSPLLASRPAAKEAPRKRRFTDEPVSAVDSKQDPDDSSPAHISDTLDHYDDFEKDILINNTQLPKFLLKRLAQEQSRRYKKLVSLKLDHARQVQQALCPSGTLCLKNQDYVRWPETAATMGFKPSRAEQGEQSGEASEYSTDLRWLPSEYPMPPTQTLPSEFECPLCFRVKKFSKPSDWAKHVCEDLQPFTCTFEGCPDAKSFKRKADWIRHENERHRQLEWWKCNMIDCAHTCFRKDNFVQHLVREHKLPEPKPRISHFRSPNDEALDKEDPVWRRVEDCRHETPKSPKDEPCRFCGNVCSSWKKLSSHLAKHMEDIAFPIWKKVLQSDVKSDTVKGSVDSAAPLQPAPKPPAYTPWYPIKPAKSNTISANSEGSQRDLAPRRSTLTEGTQSGYHPLQPIPRASSVTPKSSHFTTVNKSYQCDVQGCAHERGFATPTDLKRHQKGVHGIYDEGNNDSTYYRCQGKDCKDSGKLWPRRDNFRGHLSRKHPDEDIEELTERSTFNSKPDATANLPAPGTPQSSERRED